MREVSSVGIVVVFFTLLVVFLLPFAIGSVVFCIVCNVCCGCCMMTTDHTMGTYSSIGLVTSLYVESDGLDE